MPDLTVHATWVCSSNISWSKKMLGSKDNVYTVRFCFQPHGNVQYDYECDCPAFKFRRSPFSICKHIEKAKKERCGWNGTLEVGAQAKKVGASYVCPDCGGPVESVRVGV